MVNWINSWKSSNKKNKIDFTFRFGWLTIWEIKWCAACKKMIRVARTNLD